MIRSELKPNLLGKSNKENYEEWINTAQTTGGFALIDKDENWTSFDVVAKLRGITKIKKAGHAGTLDPLATGLLMVFFHKATTDIQHYQDLHKSYHAIVKLGATTASFDRETEETDLKDFSFVAEQEIMNCLEFFTGRIEQEPPAYSAKKIDGQRAYKLARQNVDVKMKIAQVEIFSYSDIKVELPYISFEVICSKGTYIRSLARDIGSKLGCGGYLYGLRRTGIGEYRAENALKIKEIKELNDLMIQNRLIIGSDNNESI
jgi:tRNA pseudouridine55 synthase